MSLYWREESFRSKGSTFFDEKASFFDERDQFLIKGINFWSKGTIFEHMWVSFGYGNSWLNLFVIISNKSDQLTHKSDQITNKSDQIGHKSDQLINKSGQIGHKSDQICQNISILVFYSQGGFPILI